MGGTEARTAYAALSHNRLGRVADSVELHASRLAAPMKNEGFLFVARAWWCLPVQDRLFVRRYAYFSAVIVVGTVVAWFWLQQQTQRNDALAETHAANAIKLSAEADRLPQSDFTALLPRELRTDQIVRDASSWSDDFNLRLASLSVQQSSSPSATKLQQASLNVELRGSYAGIKLWLRELLGRYPELAVVSLDLQKSLNRDDRSVSATGQLRVFARPKAEQASVVTR